MQCNAMCTSSYANAFSCTNRFTKCVRQTLYVANRKRHLWLHFTQGSRKRTEIKSVDGKTNKNCVLRKDDCSLSSRTEKPSPVTTCLSGYRGMRGDTSHSDLFIPPLFS